jgi:hypothetical protein
VQMSCNDKKALVQHKACGQRKASSAAFLRSDRRFLPLQSALL